MVFDKPASNIFSWLFSPAIEAYRNPKKALFSTLVLFTLELFAPAMPRADYHMVFLFTLVLIFFLLLPIAVSGVHESRGRKPVTNSWLIFWILGNSLFFSFTAIYLILQASNLIEFLKSLT